ncbi:MAG: hypothetical protein ACOC31_03630 [Bacteroidota bacterium]
MDKIRNTPAKVLRRMGFMTDQQGIINRYRRDKEGWDFHLRRTRSFILDCLPSAVERIVVLGSGWGLDLPLDELAEASKELILIDITHPMMMRRKARRFDHVRLVDMDLTNGAVEWFFRNRKQVSSLRGLMLSPPNLPEADLTISLNMMTQLDRFIVDYMAEKNLMSLEEIKPWREKIQRNHLQSLSSPFCLISDYEEQISYQDGQQEVIPTLYTNFPDAEKEDSWIWPFDHHGYYYTKARVDLAVKAVYSG